MTRSRAIFGALGPGKAFFRPPDLDGPHPGH